MTTIDTISDRLQSHFQGIGSAVSILEEPTYRALPHTSTKRLGIYGPMPYPRPGTVAGPQDPPVVMAFSPRYIWSLIDHLDEDDVDTYLGVLTYVGDMMITLVDDHDDRERFRRIELRFVEEWPSIAELINEVEFRAIDNGFTTVEPG